MNITYFVSRARLVDVDFIDDVAMGLERKPKKRPAAACIPRDDADEAADKSETSDSKKKQKSKNNVDEHEHDRQDVADISTGTSPQKEEETKVDAEPKPKPKSRRQKKQKTPAKAKPQPKTRQNRSKKKTNETENPFDQPPDDDQATVTSFFAEKTTNDDDDDDDNAQTGDAETKESEHVVEPHGDQSSSSSSSSSSSPEPVDFRRALGKVEDEDGSLVLDDSPCIVRADQVRSRVQMFSFPSRHVQRLKKHWGPQSVERLSQHLGDATVVSLYSGLGGAEIACHLLGKAIGKVNGDTTQAGPRPEFFLACDYNTDCQKVLNSHTVSCHHRYFLELLFGIGTGMGIRNGIEIELI